MSKFPLLPSREKVARNAPDEGAFAAITHRRVSHTPHPPLRSSLSLRGERAKLLKRSAVC